MTATRCSFSQVAAAQSELLACEGGEDSINYKRNNTLDVVSNQKKISVVFIKAGAILLVIIGVVMLIFFQHYKGRLIKIPSIVGVLFGIGITILGGRFFIYGMEKSIDEVGDENDINYLKSKGHKVSFSSSGIEIFEGEKAKQLYQEFGETEYYDEEVFDKNWGRKHKIEQPLCICIKYKGQTFTSSLIYMTRSELDKKLLAQSISLYLHPTNKKHYYFDLEFLLEE